MSFPSATTIQAASVTQVGMDPEEQGWWERLADNPNDRDAKNALVEKYLPLVKAEVQRLGCHLPRHVDRHELYADGSFGLLSAITGFDPTQGVRFSSYARKRIWGAMMDRIRSLDHVPRSVRKAARRLTEAIAEFLHEHGRQPDESELAEALGCELSELHELERQAALGQTLSLDMAPPGETDAQSVLLGEQFEAKKTEQPLDRLVVKENVAELKAALKKLPDRERAVLVLYYVEDVRIKEIAVAMGVSESRISQLHSQALLRLRGSLRFAGKSGPRERTPHERTVTSEAEHESD